MESVDRKVEEKHFRMMSGDMTYTCIKKGTKSVLIIIYGVEIYRYLLTDRNIFSIIFAEMNNFIRKDDMLIHRGKVHCKSDQFRCVSVY